MVLLNGIISVRISFKCQNINWFPVRAIRTTIVGIYFDATKHKLPIKATTSQSILNN